VGELPAAELVFRGRPAVMAWCGGVARAQGTRQRRFEGGRALYSTRGAARGSWRAGKLAATKMAARGGAPVWAEEGG